MSSESVMPSSHLILCCQLFLLPSVFSSIRVFSSDLIVHIRWPKYWSFSFSISPSNEYSGLTSFRIDWFDLLAVQGTPKSLLQHHNFDSSALSLLYGPVLTSLYDYWKPQLSMQFISFNKCTTLWQVLMMRKAMHMLRQEVYGKSLCLSLNFIVSLKNQKMVP